MRLSDAVRFCLLSAAVLAGPVLSTATGDYDAEAARPAKWMHRKAGESIANSELVEGQPSFYATGQVYTTKLDEKKLAPR